MLSAQELEKRTLDQLIAIARAMLVSAIKLHVERLDGNAEALLVQQFELRLKEVKNIPKPEVRQAQYQKIIQDLLMHPERMIPDDFIRKIRNQNIQKNLPPHQIFSAEQVRGFYKIADVMQAKQIDLDKARTTANAGILVEPENLAPTENKDHQRIRVNLHRQIDALKKLRQDLSGHQSLEKRARKSIKKAMLSVFGQYHKTKVEVLDKMISELEAVERHATAQAFKPASTAYALSQSIAQVMQGISQDRASRVVLSENKSFAKMLDDIEQPLFLASRAKINALSEQLENYMQSNLTSNAADYQAFIGIIKELKSTPKFASTPDFDYTSLSPTDLLKRFYPTAGSSKTEGRDQHVIDAGTLYMNRNPNSKLTAMINLMSQVNTINDVVTKSYLGSAEYHDSPSDFAAFLDVQLTSMHAEVKKFELIESQISDPNLIKMMSGTVQSLQQEMSALKEKHESALQHKQSKKL